MDHSHDDEGIWDELNDQQHREIEQHHHYRRAQTSTNWRIPLGNALRETAQQVTNAVVLGIGGNPQQQSHRYESLSSLLPPQSEAIDNDLGMNLFGSRQQQQQQQQLLPQRTEPLIQPNQNHPSHATARFQEHQPVDHNHNNNNNMQQQQQQQNNAYVFLQPFRLLPQRDGWGAVADLDVFFTSLYQYYYHRGFTTLALKGLVELITLFFTLGLSIFLFAAIDWSALSDCTEETTCHDNFSSYIVPFSASGSWMWKGWVFLYATIFFCYGSFSVWSWWHALQQARTSKWFMEEQLGIGERKLQSGAVDWDRDVVAKIQQLQTTGQYRIAIHGQADETLDALLVAQRIMRKDNFMVAIFNNPALLDWTVPLAPAGGDGAVFFSKSLEWTVYFCILNFMFNHKYQLRPAFYLDSNSLKRRFFLCGIAHLLFMPFLLFFMTLYFSLQNAYDWKSTQNYLGPREWSLAAKWTLREFNELPHLFEQRLEPSYDAAEAYLKLFRQHEIITAVGRIMVFIGGSLGAVLFAFAAMNDAILLHVKIADWNLLWYAGVVAAIYSAGKAMLPSQEKENHKRTYHTNLSQEMDLALEEVAKHTHHYPDLWKGRGWDKTTTYKAFTKMYQYKAKLFVQELVSIIVAPYILCVSLPRCAERVCEFILAIRAEVPGAGDMCGYSTFDFDTYGDDLWEGKTFGVGGVGVQQQSPTDPHRPGLPPVVTGSLTESIMQSGTVEATQQFPIPRAKEGKMEKSFFSFKAAHPSWKCPESGQDLVERLEEYQEEESAALARERQLHIEAAARQLETLAQLERQRNQRLNERPTVVDTSGMNDAYIGANPPTAADAGAGLQIPQQRQQLSPVAEHQALGMPLPGPANVPAHTLDQSHNMSMSSSSPRRDASQHEHREEPQPAPPFAAPASLPAGTASRLNRHPTLASSSPNNLAPPPSIFPPPTPGPPPTATSSQSTNEVGAHRQAVGAGTIGSLALSTELHRLLSMSTLDPDVGSVLAEHSTLHPVIDLARSINGLPPVEEERNRARERQYLLLERYHAHNVVASRQMQQRHQNLRQSPSSVQQSRPNPMSMSIAAGESPSGNVAAPPFGRMRYDRLGGSSLF
ncbi:Autophagy-related protein 9 [Seminavis robusta]|uniref:Autophagy-related protein 9 n=1 Tax=Seminavis robusta TaxID=568900 RepID=A0A9N8HFY9_9STRA|nr:Autophagy-related protein 9 [Seminavis robusta]|eukprot:Sro457_g146920.1 Autophagy-related protein 9 (1102) ;mRNA; f:48123-51816